MAIDFDGTGDYVSLPNNGVPGIDTALRTFAAFVTVDTAGDQLIIYLTAAALSAGQARSHLNIEEVNANTFRFQFRLNRATTAGIWQTDTDLSPGTRYHVAVTYDRGSTANDPIFYVDGVSVAFTETSTPVGAVSAGEDSVAVATAASLGSLVFNGKIAEVGHWDVILAAEQIAALARGVPPNRIHRGNLKVYMPLYHNAYGSDYAQGLLGTVAGNPTTADHPPMMPAWGWDLGWQGAFTAAAPGGGTILPQMLQHGLYAGGVH